jgi:hypothetical protein
MRKPKESPPREIGLTFGDELVRAIMAGAKTQTRRPVKRAPRARAGDVLYVREGFWVEHDSDSKEMVGSFDCGINLAESANMGFRVLYPATPNNPERPEEAGEWFGPDKLSDNPDDVVIFDQRTWVPWGKGGLFVPEFFSRRPSIHMPRWAARSFLPLIEVRDEPLDAITEEDAIAEGMFFDGEFWIGGAHPVKEKGRKVFYTARQAFFSIWNDIYADDEHGQGPLGAHSKPMVRVYRWVERLDSSPIAKAP